MAVHLEVGGEISRASEALRWVRRLRWPLLVVGVMLLAAPWAWYALAARTTSGSALGRAEEAAIWSGLGAWTALIAIMLASIGVASQWPLLRLALEDAARRPSIRLYVAHRPSADEPALPAVDVIEVGDPHLTLQCVVVNDGDRAVTNGILNIVVLANCGLAVTEGNEGPPGFRDYPRVIPAVAWNEEITDGKRAVQVRFAAIERTYAPTHAIITHLNVELPGPGDWPVLIRLDGEPGIHQSRRHVVRWGEAPLEVEGSAEDVSVDREAVIVTTTNG